MDHFWLALAWLIYFALHSLLALDSVKNYFYSIGLNPQKYRLLYVMFATVTLIAITVYWTLINSEYLFTPNIPIKMLGLIVAGWGVVIAKLGFKSYDTKAFLGLGSLDPESKLKTDGLLKKVRHPLYSGSILVLIGLLVYNPTLSTLISVLMMIIYFFIGIQLEERKLEKFFGAKYSDYKRDTPMLIPKLKGKKNPLKRTPED